MKKRLLALTMAMIMVASTMVACGGNDNPAPTEPTTGSEPAPGGEEPAPGGDEPTEPVVPESGWEATSGGAVLNIYCWNEEFKSRVTDHYADYTEVDATHGTIGDVQVVWNITPSDDNAYQNNLDETLLGQMSAAADDRIDLFLVEADYALKYVDTEYTLPVSELGIAASEYADQYTYTQDIVTDSAGVLKGVSWQGCPCVMFYNREAALDIFGTDDPDEVQAYVKDWDTFYATAADVAAAGYMMTATANDTYRVYSNNVSSPWVVNGKINVDANIEAWVEDSKAMVDAGQTTTSELWSADWSQGFYPEGKVFCYFGPAWLINFCMADGEPGSIATNGGWGACVGPQSSFWGGTWICAANGTDNADIVADIMRELTMNADVMTEIVLADDDFVNNKPAMEAMAAPDSDYSSRILGGQNPLAMYCEGAEKIDLSNLSAYDQACNEEFQQAMKNYFDGNYATYEDALAAFYTGVTEKHPELSY